MRNIKTIIVGVDLTSDDHLRQVGLSSLTEATVRQSCLLAESTAARLHFVHVVKPVATSLFQSRRAQCQQTRDDQARLSDARTRMSSLMLSVCKRGVAANGHVRFGQPSEQLLQASLELHCNLLIIGSRQCGLLRSMLTNGVASQVIRHSVCSVWVAQPVIQQFETILVAHNLQSDGDAAMEMGRTIARRHGAQLHVFHAIQFPELDSFGSRIVPATKLARHRAEAQRHIADQIEDDRFLTCTGVHLGIGAAYAPLLKLATELRPSLLVTGITARNGVSRLLRNTMAEALLPHVECSLLVAKGEFPRPSRSGSDRAIRSSRCQQQQNAVSNALG